MPGVIRNNGNGAIQLSPHFYLSEFIESDKAVRLSIPNVPDPMVTKHLYATAQLLEEVRTLLGDLPILISSGYRSPALNEAVNGANNSDHLWGGAVDFRCPAFGTPLQIAQAIANSGIQFGQLIWEGTWVHVSQPTANHQREVLTAKFYVDEHGKNRVRYQPGLVA